MFNKTSYLVLISVFILIFGLTCVSAAQDNMTTDNLSVDKNVVNEYSAIDDDSSQDDLISKSSDEKVVSENPSDEILSYYKYQDFGNVRLYIYDNVDTYEYGDDELARIYSLSDDSQELNLDGQIILSIDNKEYYNKIFYSKDYYTSVKIKTLNLNLPDNLKTGFHNVTLSYLENGKSTPYTIKNTVGFRYPPTITATYGYDSIKYTINCLYGKNGNFTVYEYIEDSGASHSSGYKGEFISSGIISNGNGEITINNLTRKDHDLRFYMDIDGQKYNIDKYVFSYYFKESKDTEESGISDDTNSNTTNTNGENEALNGTSKTFTELNEKINGNDNSVIYLDSNYTFKPGTDDKYKNGIYIDRDVTIYGNGYTLDGNNVARIFGVHATSASFKDIIFVNGNASDRSGGAINVIDVTECTAINCTFISNSAYFGGAMYAAFDSYATDCVFINNTAVYGGATGCIDTRNCRFYNNSAKLDGGAVRSRKAIDCVFINNTAKYGGAASWTTAKNCKFYNNIAKSCDSLYKSSAVNCTFNPELVDSKIVASSVKMVYGTESYYTVKVYGTDGKIAHDQMVSIKIGKFSDGMFSTDGIAKFKVTQAPGTYKVKITALGKTVTKTITVKHLVTLKTVAVKKSAKKLVLQASLGKVDGKYLNKKIVTFKFNGKTYKAKTNSKGVAKYTLKSSVLKKLKVGKKITYQATYLKDTVKKTAKVKK